TNEIDASWNAHGGHGAREIVREESQCQRLCPPYKTGSAHRRFWQNETRRGGVRFPPTQERASQVFAKTKPPERKHARTQRHNADFLPHQPILAGMQNRFPRRIKML